MTRCGTDLNGPQYKLWAEEALRYAREAGDLAVESQALNALAFLSAGPGSLAAPDSEPLRLIAKARAIALEAGAYWPILKTVITESHLLCGAGDYERAAAVARQGITDAERYGVARTTGAILALNVAEPLLALGRWDEAEEVAERALDLAPPPLTRAGLWIVSGYVSLARGNAATAGRRAAASRAVLSGAGYEDQHQLPQAMLDIEVAFAADGPATAVAAAAEALERYDLSVSSPRYVWPLVVGAAAAARQARVAGTDRADSGDGAEALLDRLRTLAKKLEVFGPVQRAWQLTFAAIDSAPSATPDERLAACDAAVAAWEAVQYPYQTAIALVAGARAALASEDSSTGATKKREASARLRRVSNILAKLGAATRTQAAARAHALHLFGATPGVR
jgi:tetratricopeptide (TPR) repeat protein